MLLHICTYSQDLGQMHWWWEPLATEWHFVVWLIWIFVYVLPLTHNWHAKPFFRLLLWCTLLHICIKNNMQNAESFFFDDYWWSHLVRWLMAIVVLNAITLFCVLQFISLWNNERIPFSLTCHCEEWWSDIFDCLEHNVFFFCMSLFCVFNIVICNHL